MSTRADRVNQSERRMSRMDEKENLKIVMKPLDDLIPYANNPRINDDSVDAVAASIHEFGFKVPMVIDRDNTIVAGHTRYKAAKKLKLTEVPCIVADDLTPAQIKAFRLADNKVGESSVWDMELLGLEMDDLDMDMTLFGFDDEEETPEKYDGKGDSGTLIEKFIAPPFSILDTRQGYWQDRKRAWKSLGLRSEVGRDEALLGDGLKQLAEARHMNLTGTSIFDPVLCEIVYQWFCTENGKVFDCFAGGSVRGVIAAYLGYDYTGIDLRQEQVDANIENAKEIGVEPKWYCDDSQNADKYVKDESCDLVFSCPPYADLEQYSDDPRDISTMEYPEFLKVYANIINTALRKLKQDRFAVFVVGDIRDKQGFYRNFISDTKDIFLKNEGVHLYNEIILVEQLATGPLRANRQFSGSRKVVKCHQNVLVFFKGDPKTIKNNYPEVEVADLPDAGEGQESGENEADEGLFS